MSQPALGCVNFQFVDRVASVTLSLAIDEDIAGIACAEGDRVGTAIARALTLDPRPVAIIRGDFDIILSGILTVPLDDDLANLDALTQIDLEPLGTAAAHIPAGAAVAVYGTGGPVTAALVV